MKTLWLLLMTKKYWELKESTRMMNSQKMMLKKLTWLKKEKKVFMKLLSAIKLLITL